MSATVRGFVLVTHVATLDVPRHVVDHLSRLPAAHRRQIDAQCGSRALGPFRQAVLVLRWFRERGCVHCLARDVGISQATGYRYLHEGIGILADWFCKRELALVHFLGSVADLGVRGDRERVGITWM